MFESEMTTPVRTHFCQRGFSVLEEYRILGKKVDLLCIDGEHSSVVAVELKLRDWRRGLHQCTQNASFSNQSYLAIWHEALHNVNLSALERSGIGLLSVGIDSVSETLGARYRRFNAVQVVSLSEDNRFDGGDI